MLQEQKQTSRRPLHLSASLMTPEQCAQFLGIKINTLYVMKSQGRSPYRKAGHHCASTWRRLSNGPRTKNEFGNENSSGTIPPNLCGCNRRKEVMFFDSVG